MSKKSPVFLYVVPVFHKGLGLSKTAGYAMLASCCLSWPTSRTGNDVRNLHSQQTFVKSMFPYLVYVIFKTEFQTIFSQLDPAWRVNETVLLCA